MKINLMRSMNPIPGRIYNISSLPYSANKLPYCGKWDSHNFEIKKAPLMSCLEEISPAQISKFGNKACRLAQIKKLGFPVPDAFVISSDMEFTENSWPEISNKIGELEEKTGKKFGDPNNPLHLSVRSSPLHSMPGLLYTGLNIATKDILIKAILEVRNSWQSETAQKYRAQHGISDELGTAVIVQRMVSGNLNNNCAAGVLFTNNPVVGDGSVSGRFAIKSEGREIVYRSKKKTEPILLIKDYFEKIPPQFDKLKERFEREFKNVQEIEFVIENGELWVLQTKDATLSPRAQAKAALSLFRRGIIDKFIMLDMLEKASRKEIYQLVRPAKYNPDHYHYYRFNAIGWGCLTSPGVAVGPIVFCLENARHFVDLGKQPILVALKRQEDISRAILSGEIGGIVTQYGHEALHETVLANFQGIPMLETETVDAGRFITSADAAGFEINGDTLVIGANIIKEGTEVVMGAITEKIRGEYDTENGALWIKKEDPGLIKERVVILEEIDFDYLKEKEGFRNQFSLCNYDMLLLSHAELIRQVAQSPQITRDTIRSDLAAQAIHKLIGEKGLELGKSPDNIVKDVLQAYSRLKSDSNSVFHEIMENQDLYNKFGIRKIEILDSGYNFVFFNGQITNSSSDCVSVQDATQHQQHFANIIKHMDSHADIEIHSGECDPMPHGHPSFYLDLVRSVKINLGLISKPECLRALNKLIIKLFSLQE